MSEEALSALRIAFLTSGEDCPMSVEEVRAMTGWSESKLMASSIPRGKEGNRVFFLKSQVRMWFTLRIEHPINPVDVEQHLRRSA